MPEAEIRLKFLPRVRKTCESAGRMTARQFIPTEPQIVLEPHSDIDRSVTGAPPRNRQKPDLVEEDVSYFICSLIAELHARNLVISAESAAQRVGHASKP